MNLWIRSQDKEELLKINNRLFIKEIINIGFSVENDLCVDDGFISLGIYKTKERALKVLDEIQSLLMPKLILNSYDNITPEFSENVTIMPISTDIKQFNSYVYEMPEE